MRNWGDGSEDDALATQVWELGFKSPETTETMGGPGGHLQFQGEGTGVSVERWQVRLDCLQALPMDVYSHVHPDIQTHAWKKRGRCLGLGALSLRTGLMPPSWKKINCPRSDFSYKSLIFSFPPLPLLLSARVCKALSGDRKFPIELPNKFFCEFAFTHIWNEHVKTAWGTFWYCPLFPVLQVVSLLPSFLSPGPTLPPWSQTS